jgi:hypothetical protein
MQWSEFTASLKEAKKRKKNKGISVPTIATLLFGGAMDSMIPPETPKTVELYKKMFEEVKTALGSKANLAKKKKTELIGLSDVHGHVSLSLWRHQMSPLSTFNIIPSCQENLKLYGFVDSKHLAYPLKRAASEKYPNPVLLTPYWSKVFQNPIALKAFQDGEYDLAILGVITDVAIKPFADGAKERMIFKIFTGHEYTNDITVWPGEDGKIPQRILMSVKPMELGFAIVKPKTWNGQPGATLLRWQKLIK